MDRWSWGAAAAADTSGTTFLIVAVLVALALWLLSLWLHPLARCRRCGGTGKQFGSAFTGSFRMCTSCGGNGRRKRAFASLIRTNR